MPGNVAIPRIANAPISHIQGQGTCGDDPPGSTRTSTADHSNQFSGLAPRKRTPASAGSERPSEGLASPDSENHIPLLGLPIELLLEVIGYLDPPSMRNASGTCRKMKDSIELHTRLENIRAARELAKNVLSGLAAPTFEEDTVTVEKLRKLSGFLSSEKAAEIIDAALIEHERDGFRGAKLIGAVLRGHPEMAPETADKLRNLQTQHRGAPTTAGENPDVLARSYFVAHVLSSLGDGAEETAYLPFTELLRSGNCIANIDLAQRIAQSIPDLPPQERDTVASFVLDQESHSYFHTLNVFFQLPHLSPVMQDKVFLKARAAYNSRTGHAKKMMVSAFSVNWVFSEFSGTGLTDEVKNKWRELLPDAPSDTYHD